VGKFSMLHFVFVAGSFEADETIMIERPELDDTARNLLSSFRQALLDAGKCECFSDLGCRHAVVLFA
jgi:hypothetical protein